MGFLLVCRHLARLDLDTSDSSSTDVARPEPYSSQHSSSELEALMKDSTQSKWQIPDGILISILAVAVLLGLVVANSDFHEMVEERAAEKVEEADSETADVVEEMPDERSAETADEEKAQICRNPSWSAPL